MAKKLTIKQKKFVKAYVANDGNGTRAALEAYDTVDENTAHAIASENLQKPTVRESIEAALLKHKIDMDTAVAPIAEALRHEQLDYRLKGSDRALKLMGADNKPSEGGNTYNFTQINNEMKSKYDD